jgi:hypothetical protein
MGQMSSIDLNLDPFRSAILNILRTTQVETVLRHPEMALEGLSQSATGLSMLQ